MILVTVINKVQSSLKRYLMRICPPLGPLHMSIQVKDLKLRPGITAALRVPHLT